MKKLRYMATLFLLLIMAACQKDLPKPETKDITFGVNQVIPASGYVTAASDPFFVRHQIKGKDVYIECIVEGVSFRNNGAKMILFIDGKKIKEINNAAFVVKGLNTGTHRLKLELIKQNERTAAASKEIEVTIQ